MVDRIRHGVLTPNVVKFVSAGPSKITTVRVLNVTGTERIYVRADETDPAAPWDGCEVIPPAVGWVTLRVDSSGNNPGVRMVSPGSPEYCVKFS